MKQLIKNSFFFLLQAMYGRRLHAASILMYHSIGDNQLFFTVTPENFERQLCYLKAQRLEVILLSELCRRLQQQRSVASCVCLTFDDGYADNVTVAYPLLQKYNMPATIFLVTDQVEQASRSDQSRGKDISPKMTTADVQRLAQEGLVEFMPHTEHHKNLAMLSFAEACSEIEISRQKVERWTGRSASLLAYPKGRYTEALCNYLEQHGWAGAVTVEPGLVSPHSNLFLLPRNSVDSLTSLVQFKVKVSDGMSVYEQKRS